MDSSPAVSHPCEVACVHKLTFLLLELWLVSSLKSGTVITGYSGAYSLVGEKAEKIKQQTQREHKESIPGIWIKLTIQCPC